MDKGEGDGKKVKFSFKVLSEQEYKQTRTAKQV
jgi:hypothetical protein